MAKFLKIRFRSGLTVALFIVWSISMFLVYDKNYATSKDADLTDIPIDQSLTGGYQNWMNIFMGKDKIGYSMQSLNTSPLGYIMKEYSLILLPLGGTIKEVHLDSYSVLNLDYSLKSFTFGLISGDYTTDVFGEMKNNELLIKMKSQESETKAVFNAPNGIYLPGAIPLLARAKKFPQGSFTLPTFDPLSVAINDLNVALGPKESIKTGDTESMGYRLSLVFAGVATTMWIDDTGRVLLEEEAAGMKMVKTNRDDALDMPVVNIEQKDLLIALAVPCKGEIKDPRNITYMKVMLEGIEPGIFDLNDDFQKIVSTNPLVLEIHPNKIDSSNLDNSDKFLKTEPFLQVDDPRIIEASNSIVGQIKNPLNKAEKIGEWVFANLKKDYAISLPSAVDVLKVRKGDCNEHTTLYTALARAAGLPTKICIGIVYKDGYFYYHAWPAVYVGGWRPLDPTFGQKTTDATHIKLLEGGLERQADLMRIVGKLSVTIINYSSGENL